MKLFVVSDIHGHARLLKEALENAGYDPGNDNHFLICCGDLFDRGTENYEVLKTFERIKRKVIIKGNHEERLLEILDIGRLGEHDFLNGTIETIHEFFGKNSVINLYDPIDFSGKTGMIRRLSDFIGETQDYYETEHYIFVHGWLPNDHGSIVSNWRNASERQWRNSRWTWWTKGCEMPGNTESKTIVCGHYPTRDSKIHYGEGFIAIDAGAALNKRINVLTIDDNLL